MSAVTFVVLALAGFLFTARDSAEYWCHALGFARRNWARVTLGALPVVFLAQSFTWLPGTGDREMTWTWWQHLCGDARTWVAIGLLVVLATRSGITAKVSSA